MMWRGASMARLRSAHLTCNVHARDMRWPASVI
jgi:hypothetical protein